MAKEYIEREAFIKTLKKTKNDCEHYPNKVVCDFAIRMVNLMPPADVQKVRRIISKIDGEFCGGDLSDYCDRCGQSLDWSEEND